MWAQLLVLPWSVRWSVLLWLVLLWLGQWLVLLWLEHWLVHRMEHWMVCWLVHRMVCWLVLQWLVHRMVHWMVCWLVHRMVSSMVHSLELAKVLLSIGTGVQCAESYTQSHTHILQHTHMPTRHRQPRCTPLHRSDRDTHVNHPCMDAA